MQYKIINNVNGQDKLTMFAIDIFARLNSTLKFVNLNSIVGWKLLLQLRYKNKLIVSNDYILIFHIFMLSYKTYVEE